MAKQKIEGSKFFSVEEKGDKKYLHTEMVEGGFEARNIQADDLGFYNQLFSNEQVVSLYGDGKTKDAAWVKGRFDTWDKRFLETQPHGGMTVLDSETKKPIGFVVAGGGDEKGASEMAAAFEPTAQNQGICTRLLKSAVQEWGPEVRKIGLGEMVDSKFPDLQKAFSCFGGAPLSRFDATYSPLNKASGSLLAKVGFTKATSCLVADNPFDLTCTGLSLTKIEDIEAVMKKFLNDGERKENTRYICIDQDGKEGTLSFKKNFNAFRYHVESDISR